MIQDADSKTREPNSLEQPISTPSHAVTEASPSLSEVLFDSPRRNFGSLAPLPSNVQAIDASLLFSAGLHSFVALVGPSGWGKSHLLEAVSTRLGIETKNPPPVFTATEWALGTTKSEFNEPLLLDNVQDAIEQSRTRQALRLALERRVRAGRPTLLSFTASKPGRHIRSLLPSSRDWVLAQINTPEGMERVLVFELMAQSENLSLSEPLIKLIAYRMRGNGRTLIGALKRLKLYGTQWVDSRGTLRACGALDPFFVDNSGWDLREAICRAVEPGEIGRSDDLALYLMLREACLSEAQVARFFNIEPSEAYLRAAAFERQIIGSDHLKARVTRTIDRIVRGLLQD